MFINAFIVHHVYQFVYYSYCSTLKIFMLVQNYFLFTVHVRHFVHLSSCSSLCSTVFIVHVHRCVRCSSCSVCSMFINCLSMCSLFISTNVFIVHIGSLLCSIFIMFICVFIVYIIHPLKFLCLFKITFCSLFIIFNVFNVHIVQLFRFLCLIKNGDVSTVHIIYLFQSLCLFEIALFSVFIVVQCSLTSFSGRCTLFFISCLCFLMFKILCSLFNPILLNGLTGQFVQRSVCSVLTFHFSYLRTIQFVHRSTHSCL